MKHPLFHLIKDKPLLENLAREYGTPLYLYDKKQLVMNINDMDKVLGKYFKKYRICYTIKANSNPNLIRILKSKVPDLGADCSSPGEIHAANLGNILSKECLYTGNYESEDDLKVAIENKVHLNLDDINSFKRIKKYSIPNEISFRLNPGFGKGAFSQITTGGVDSKFGVPRSKIIDAYGLAKANGVKKFGIQCMTGSGILDAKYFPKLMSEILNIANSIMRELNINFEYINMGGGYGIPYKDEDASLDIDEVFSNVSKVFHKFFSGAKIPEFWIEPGRSIVGNIGILLSRVTGIKNSYKNFVGLDAGMETLMRPALYNAYHRIYKVGNPQEKHSQVTDITGRICENTDRLAIDRSFPNVKVNDLIAVMDVGAYGFSMSHQFCNRPRAAEVLLDKNSGVLIRRRETIQDLFVNC